MRIMEKLSIHKPVLLKEIIRGLDLKSGDVVFDGTLGGGGHSLAICQKIEEKGNLLSVDLDKDAIERSKNLFAENKVPCQFNFKISNFKDIGSVAAEFKMEKFNKAVLDLGLSSDQLEISERGFTFQKDEPLLMTFGDGREKNKLTAEEILNEWEEKNLADIIYGYGGERFSRKIAKAIVESRQTRPIKTSGHLVEIISRAVPLVYKRRKIHFATKTFQALRITVNDELGSLRGGLSAIWFRLRPEGRLAVISFHELEDRIVKNFFKAHKIDGDCLILTKKPILPSREEMKDNKRSRSAKLRIGQKI